MFDKRVTQIAAISAEGESYYNKGDVPAFLKWLQARPETYVYALNIQYDLGNLFGDELDKLDCTLVGGRMIRAVWGDKIFLDVYNIWFQSVKDLGNVFGLKKLETESMASDKEYVFRDVEIIREAMLYVWNFAAQFGLEGMPATLGGLGVALWRAWGGETVPDSLDISRAARFGGRVELFKVQSESRKVGYCDINSLYPFAMLGEFPSQLEHTGTRPKRLGMAEVTIEVPECEIASLPYRTEEGRIIYGFGRMTGTWTLVEIRNAEENGAKLVKVHDSYSTNEGIWSYRTYMQRIYAIRLESKSPAEKELYKRLMNCLYGRTGTSGEISRTVLLSPKNKDKGPNFGERVLVKYKMPLAEEINWSHCAHITAYGRLELFKYLKTVGAEKLIYCDTDSVIFDCADGVIPFQTGSALGEMKIEAYCPTCKNYWKSATCSAHEKSNFWPQCEAYAPKMYKLGNNYKAKGVPKRLQEEFIVSGRAEYDMPFKFREAVAFYDRGNAKKLSVWRKIVKEWQTRYDKKKLDGNRFFPLQIDGNFA